jgi:D-alanyl-D-alanine carboxypeptidase (penicillin-binding protein 5/6)
MKSLKIWLLFMAFWFLFCTPSCLLANDELVTNGKSVILMDAKSGRILYENNSTERVPPASLTKIMTGLLICENGNLNKKVIISEYAAATPESTAYLEAGEVLTRLELLYAAMLVSANDACVALAESMVDSETDFVEIMNRRANELGAYNTHFVNPHGLHDENHYSTAYDLAILTRVALVNPVFAEVVSTQRKIIPWDSRPDEDRILLNKNRLLYRYEDAVGVKTGYTRQAGNCVVGAAQRGDMLLIAVSLNSSTVYEDLETLLEFGFDNYHMAQLGKTQDLLWDIMIEDGESPTVRVRPVMDLQVAVTDEEVPYLSYSLSVKPKNSAPIRIGDILGTCKIYLEGEQVGQIEVIAQDEVLIKQMQAPALLRQPLLNLCVTLGILGVLILLFSKYPPLQNGLKRLILLLLRKRIPSQYRRPRY